MNMTHIALLCLLALLYILPSTEAQIEGIYCGKENCYSVLGVTRDDDKAAIMRAYRKLARVHHPDRQRTVEGRKDAELKFKSIATAYEILRDEEQRKEYDYMLDNPEAMYYHYYQYFKRKMGPKVDVRLVFAVFITLFSITQYYVQWTNFHDGLNYCLKLPKFRIEAKEYAKTSGMLEEVLKAKKQEKGKKVTKLELKQCEENVLKDVVANHLKIKAADVKVGTIKKPSVYNTLWVQMFTIPVWLWYYLCAWTRWIVLYYILRKEFVNDADKLEQIRWNLQASREVWSTAEQDELDYYMKRKLWIKENYDIYAEECDAERRKRLADDSKYKRYQRLMRKGGPGQMTFGQDDVDMDFN